MISKYIIVLIVMLIKLTFSQNAPSWKNELDSILTVDPFKYELQIRAIIKRGFDDRTERYSRLIEDQEKVIELAKKGKNNKKLIDAWMKLAILNELAARYNEAAINLFEALVIAESTSDSVSLGKIKIRIDDLNYINFGVTVHKENTYEGVELIGRSNDPEDIGFYHFIKSKLAKDKDSFIYHCTKAYNIQRKLVEEDPLNEEKQIRLSKYLNSMSVHAEDPTKYLNEAIHIATKFNEHYFKLFYVNNLGSVYEERADYNKALEQYYIALSICFEHRFPTLLRNTTSNIARVYRALGNLKQALWFSKIEIIAIEAGHEELSEVKYDDLRIQYELGKKEALLSSLRDESNELKRLMNSESWQKYILTFGVIVLIIVAIHIQIARKKIDAVKTAIEKEKDIVSLQKEKLEDLNAELSEKERSLREAQAIARLANWQWNIKERKLTYSENLPKLFSLGAKEIELDIRKALLPKVHKEDLDIYKKYMFGDHILIESGEVSFRIFVGKHIRWISSKFSVLFDSNKSPEKIVHTVQDITLRKLEEENKLKLIEQRTFTRKLIDSQENERRRIAGELHDGIGQEILLLKSKAQLGMLNPNVEVEAKERLMEIGELADGMIQSIRDITFDLSPVLLTKVGLTETISESISKINEGSQINFQFKGKNIDHLSSLSEEVIIFRIIQEGLNNIIKHSQATNASVLVNANNHFLFFKIADNGIGFDVKLKEKKSKGLGLGNIYNRVNLLKGKIKIISSAESGTEIKIKIPLQANDRKNTNNYS